MYLYVCDSIQGPTMGRLKPVPIGHSRHLYLRHPLSITPPPLRQHLRSSVESILAADDVASFPLPLVSPLTPPPPAAPALLCGEYPGGRRRRLVPAPPLTPPPPSCSTCAPQWRVSWRPATSPRSRSPTDPPPPPAAPALLSGEYPGGR